MALAAIVEVANVNAKKTPVSLLHKALRRKRKMKSIVADSVFQ